MKQAQVKAVLPFMIAFAEGKTIQIKNHVGSGPEWRDVHDPLFAGYAGDYRIKPEPDRLFMVANSAGTWGKYTTLKKAEEELAKQGSKTLYKIYECVEVL